MTEVSIIASKSRATFNVPFQIGENVFSMKFDTGAASTVISSEIFIDEMTEEKKSTIKNFLQERNVIGIEFTSASGDCFVGYLIHANGVVVDEAVFADFYYYLVLDNKRVIALLGDDFIDHCEFQHNVHGDIVITGFDFAEYGNFDGAMENDELLYFLDETVTNRNESR